MFLFSNFINKFLSRYIIYTKILQWINFDFLFFLGKDFNSFLRKFTDNAPYIDEDIDYYSLKKLNELGSKYSIIIDEIPINSGTISLVFKGSIIVDGVNKKIAIKILRNGIENKIKNCVNTFKFLFSLTSYIPLIKNLNLDILFEDAKENLIEQIDFKKESKFIKLFDIKLNKHKHIKTIKLIDDLSFDNVIVMEFIEGKSIFNLDKNDKEIFMDKLITTFFYIQMKKGLFHLDLHPGNMLYTSDNRIAFLDVGMALELKIEESNYFFDFVKLFEISDIELSLIKIINEHKKILFKYEIDIDTEKFVKNLISKKPKIFTVKNSISFTDDTAFFLNEFKLYNYDLSKRMNQILFGLISFINIFINLKGDLSLLMSKNVKIYE